MNDNDIQNFINTHNYDLRVSHYGRWIDQKCTPDVLWSIADFVLNYIDAIGDTFNATAIWKSEYAKETIRETFSKPEVDDRTAESEYDKVFSQPLCLLDYAGVLEDIGNGNRHLYRVVNRDVLEYIASNDVHSLRFLQMYIEKVLTDSDIMPMVNQFFERQDVNSFDDLKTYFIQFYHRYTKIKEEYEPRRIFTKVINPLAFKYRKKGTVRGRMSRDIINRSDMMYNRDNFRDVYTEKPKGVSRREWLESNPEIQVREGYFIQMMNAAKRRVKQYNDLKNHGLSELTQFVQEHDDRDPANQLHHIFPKNEFPEIMYYTENLIALTPNQHFNYAHPNNNTQLIDIDAQKVLLIAKACSIKRYVEEEDGDLYCFDDFIFVLSVGWDDDSVHEIQADDYADLLHAINYHYNSDVVNAFQN